MSRWHTTLCDRVSDANVTKHKNVLGMPLNNSDDDDNNISNNNNNNNNILKLILAIHHVNALLQDYCSKASHSAMSCQVNPSWWTHWAISHSSQCSTIGITKTTVYAILSLRWCI